VIWIALTGASVAAGWLLGRGDAAANLQAVREGAPVWSLVLLLGLVAGGYGRDRIRLRRSYASPTRGWLGKMLCGAGLLPGIVFAASPVDWSAGALPGLAALAAAGLAVWLGNLPEKL
jgi:hypothetical protein